MKNALTIDVEEYFHPSEVQLNPKLRDWDRLPSRVEYQTLEVLDVLDRHKIKATFFILGWVAKRKPRLIQEIVEAGHEIGCHSFGHQLVYSLTPAQFREDTLQAIAAIEDACGVSPEMYRAPSYSITKRSLWALEILIEAGFTYDSSIYPIVHDRYGIPGFPRHATRITTPSGTIEEIPIATVTLSKSRVAPVGGGGYLRLLPYRYTAAGLRRVNEEEHQPGCIYFHPWEFDFDQPRLASGVISRLRTYSGLRTMSAKLDRLLTEFQFAPIGEVYGKTTTETNCELMEFEHQ